MGGKALRRADERDALPTPEPAFHRARASISIGRLVDLDAEAQITSGGLLAVGGAVAAILLSTAVIVGVATRGRQPRRITAE